MEKLWVKNPSNNKWELLEPYEHISSQGYYVFTSYSLAPIFLDETKYGVNWHMEFDICYENHKYIGVPIKAPLLKENSNFAFYKLKDGEWVIGELSIDKQNIKRITGTWGYVVVDFLSYGRGSCAWHLQSDERFNDNHEYIGEKNEPYNSEKN